MEIPTLAVLEGGPDDLTERVIPLQQPGAHDLKIPFRGGYEHFMPTPRYADTENGSLPVYVWCERTKIAE
ncbi:hypothetical protein D5S17_29445 [Pseudonocardiaceae bacterium YIM PH 21723]|nr:hypothetical protein D5S17_29445 [Pseudonocardiaceae bacterium YIM PH 21723]